MSDSKIEKVVETVKEEVSPAKPKSSKKVLIIITAIVAFLFLCTAFASAASYYWYKKNVIIDNPDLEKVEEDEKKYPGENEEEVEATPAPELTGKIIGQTRAKALTPNTVYFGEYEGQKIMYLQNGSERDFSMVSYIQGYEGDRLDEVDFSKLKNVEVLAEGQSQQEIYFDDFVLSSDGKKVYFSTFIGENDNYNYPVLGQVFSYEFATNKRTEYYSRDVMTIDGIIAFDGREINTKEYHGTLHVELLEKDKYLIVRVPKCYACDEIGPGYILVLNLVTLQDKFISHEAGDFKFDHANNKMSYKKYVYDSGECEGSEDYCWGGYVTKGDYITTTLP